MIYFAHAVGTDLVKIGFTAGDPAKRLKELQTGCPQRLELLWSGDGEIEDEAAVHKKFSHLRQQGEWFRLAPELTIFIATRGGGIGSSLRDETWALANAIADVVFERDRLQALANRPESLARTYADCRP